MVGIGTGTVADNFCQWCGTTRQRMFQRFNNQHAGTFPHDKTVAGTVEWPGGFFCLFR
ncbi:hypothetical protein D3C76_1716940 [compost metagenome]